MEINEIKDPKNISIDQIIKIPAKMPYTVKRARPSPLYLKGFMVILKIYIDCVI